MKTINPTYAQALQAAREQEERANRIVAGCAVLFILSAAALYIYVMVTELHGFTMGFEAFTLFLMMPPVVLISIALFILFVYVQK